MNAPPATPPSLNRAHRPTTLLLCSLLLTIADGTVAEADNEAQRLQQQMQALQHDIDEYRSAVDTTTRERDEVQGGLASSEKAINELLKDIDTLRRDIKSGESRIRALRDEQTRLAASRDDQTRRIIAQMRTAQRIGDSGLLQVLLSQQDPTYLSRMTVYLKHITQARHDRIADFSATLARLQQIEQTLRDEVATLQQRRTRLADEHSHLAAHREQRQTLLTRLQTRLEDQDAHLRELQANHRHLEGLLERITSRLADIDDRHRGLPFRSLRGKLPMPVRGTLQHRFGSSRVGNRVHWEGVVIQADAGTPVQAIHHGRVVFADWLRGFGLMIIISHGEGYMSLYGHNQQLYLNPGEWVDAGDIIASVGASGGRSGSGLYFEIRHNGQPADPTDWCTDNRA